MQLLIPSFSDLFFVFFIFWAFLAAPGGWQGLLRDADTGFHIRVGELILKTHTVPVHDPFSFALPGEHWYAFEWLSQVLLAFLYQWAGLKGVVLISGLVLATTFTVVLRHAISKGSNALVTVALVLAASSAATIHFHARPHIFTMLLLATSVWIVDRDRTAHTWLLWTLPLIAMVWANLHGGFFLFLVLLGFLVLGSVLEGRLINAGRYATVLILSSAATLINPYGIRLPMHVFEVLRAKFMLMLVDEFKAPDFRSESHLAFMVLLFLALGVAIPLLKKNRVTEVLWLVFLAYCSLTSVRHMAVFAIVCVPIIAPEWTALLTEWKPSRPLLDSFAAFGAKFATNSIWLVVFAAALASAGGIHWPSDFDRDSFPSAIASKVPAEARVFTTDQWANYLIFKDPRQQVLIDSQHQMYGEKVLSEALGLMAGNAGWRESLDRYKVNVVLCPRGVALESLLSQETGWRKIAGDPQASLFAR